MSLFNWVLSKFVKHEQSQDVKDINIDLYFQIERDRIAGRYDEMEDTVHEISDKPPRLVKAKRSRRI